jgi:hypothetical protein
MSDQREQWQKIDALLKAVQSAPFSDEETERILRKAKQIYRSERSVPRKNEERILDWLYNFLFLLVMFLAGCVLNLLNRMRNPLLVQLGATGVAPVLLVGLFLLLYGEDPCDPLEDAKPAVRGQAVTALREEPRADSIPKLLKVLRQDRDDGVGQLAAAQLGELARQDQRDKAAVEQSLFSLLQDENSSVRARAAYAFGEINPQNRPLLAGVLGHATAKGRQKALAQVRKKILTWEVDHTPNAVGDQLAAALAPGPGVMPSEVFLRTASKGPPVLRPVPLQPQACKVRAE